MIFQICYWLRRTLFPAQAGIPAVGARLSLAPAILTGSTCRNIEGSKKRKNANYANLRSKKTLI